MATLLLLLVSALAAFDGIYFHFLKGKLHATRGSRQEHWLHVALGLGFWGTVYCWYWRPVPGWGVFFLILQWVTFTVDMVTERWTRRPQGGLPDAEKILHVSVYGTLLLSNALAVRAGPASTPGSRFGIELLLWGAAIFMIWQLALIVWKSTKVSAEC